MVYNNKIKKSPKHNSIFYLKWLMLVHKLYQKDKVGSPFILSLILSSSYCALPNYKKHD